jgi:hypothetical protein
MEIISKCVETPRATYDSWVAFVFRQQQNLHEGTTLGPIQYIKVLRDIIRLNYGPVSQPIILFKCDWVKNGVNKWGNPMYKDDEDGFLLANFC